METGASSAGRKSVLLGADPIRLNLFFDLLSTLLRARDLESLGAILGTQLRYVIDFVDCYFIVGNPNDLPLCKVYLSTKSTPCGVLQNVNEARSAVFEKALESYSSGLGAQAGGAIVCLPLSTPKGLMGALILKRAGVFKQSEYRFVEAIGGFLAQMLENFAATTKLVDVQSITLAGENYQKIVVQKLEDERELRERFVSALSHDLRSPLTAAKLASQLLLKKSDDPKMVVTLAQRINASVDRVDRMILDLLDANRIKGGDNIPTTLEQCPFDEIVASIVDDLSYIYGPRLVMQIESVDSVGFCDRNAIQRILENLVTNAVKYGATKTPITVHLSSGIDWIEISVHNQGGFISEADQKTVFGQFSRTQSAIGSGQKGWGIGLSLVKAIAKAHGGFARVESSIEMGTTFYVRLLRDARTADTLPIRLN